MLSTNQLYKSSTGLNQLISFTADEDEILVLIDILISHPLKPDDLGKTKDHIIDNLLHTLTVAFDQIHEAK